MAIVASRVVNKRDRNDAQIDWDYPPLTSLVNLAQIELWKRTGIDPEEGATWDLI